MKHHAFHAFIWKLCRPLVQLITRILFGYTCDKVELTGPFLLVCNHNTDLDPLMLCSSVPQQMYFIASEHVVRSGLGGRLLRWLQDPIPRQKGGSASSAVMAALRRLKAGCNVALFPEGHRSWDGLTAPFPAATGKLVRSAAAAGAALVTYRLEGAYFASPPWGGKRIRRGRCSGHLVHVYSPEELRALRPGDINELIARDLACDNYALQQQRQIPFKTRHGAEHLETFFFLCPRCGGVSTLHSQGDSVTCSACSLTVRYLPTGFLEGELPFDTVRDWNSWQLTKIRSLCENAGDGPIFTDDAMELYAVQTAKGRTLLHRGSLALYRDRLEMPGVTLPLEEIQGISVRCDQDLYLGTQQDFYLLRSDQVRCTSRYLTAIAMLTGREFGV